MWVRIKTWLPAALGAVALSAIADKAAAQCAPAGCQPPPPPCCEPPPPPPPPPPCCESPAPPPPSRPGDNFNVNVNVNNVYNNSRSNSGSNSDSSARANVNARSGAGSFSYGGGGGGSAYVTVEQPYPTTISGLNVEGGRFREVIRVPFEAWRRIEKRVVIRAVCIDDRMVPHPASQVRPGKDVDYEGELYRCLAGTRLQYTWAEYVSEANFDHGESFTCAKGESLWYGRRRYEGEGMEGGRDGGYLECRPQKPERDCNERSLLRRYGAGIKILSMIHEERYTEYREEYREVAGSVVTGASMVLDGGVGGRVF